MKVLPPPRLFACLFACAVASSTLSQPYTFTTIAGKVGVTGFQDGTNTQATFNTPAGLALDNNGVLYVADILNHTIRQIRPEGTNWIVTTLAGLSTYAGFADGTNSEALFDHPTGVAVDRDGSLFVTDKYNNCIRKVTPVGTNWVVTTIAGQPGPAGQAYADGTNRAALFWGPSGLAFDNSGNLYVADSSTCTIRQIVREDTNWITRTIAGYPYDFNWGDGPNQIARFNYPWAVTATRAGVLYVADFGNDMIRAIQPTNGNWLTTTIAGSGTMGTNDGPANLASFNNPSGVAVWRENRVSTTDYNNYTVRGITPDATNWFVATIGGAPLTPGSADGTGSIARFRKPYGIVADKNGILFVADYVNRTIRMGVSIPAVSISLAQDEGILSWPLWATNYVLETSPRLAPNASWTPLTNDIAVSGSSFVLTNNAVGSSFFRLRQL